MHVKKGREVKIMVDLFFEQDFHDLPVDLQERITSFLSKLDERQKCHEQSQGTPFSHHG
jgi:hypothetical protein